MKSQLMSLTELSRLQVNGKTLEQDARGIKVSLLPDGNIFKVFKLRGIFTSSRLYSNAHSFCRNAQRLQRLEIPTVKVLQLYHFEHSSDTAVLYEPVQGETVRNLLEQALANDEMFEKLGIFIASLHNKGVYFRSMHLGNVVYYQGVFGLIDIADMRIYPWRLFFSTIKRNFNRMVKYKADMLKISTEQKEILIRSYLDQSNLSIQKQQALYEHFAVPSSQSS